MTPSTNQSTNQTNQTTTTTPYEVGWMFVREYYHFMHREPQRLHCFYGKDSSAQHGLEGVVVNTSHGQQEIYKLIKDLSLSDCRVVISNVDSQLSREDGVMVQVLGEMSNNGLPSQKFVQTFFLAKQPKGYYILNDIFRFLREEVEEDDVDEEENDEDTPEVVSAPVPEKPKEVVQETAKRAPSPVKPKSKSPSRVVEPVAQPKPVSAPAAKSREASPKVQAKETNKQAGRANSPPKETPVAKPAAAPAAPKAPNTWARIASATTNAPAAATPAPASTQQASPTSTPSAPSTAARTASPVKKAEPTTDSPKPTTAPKETSPNGASRPPTAQATSQSTSGPSDSRPPHYDIHASVYAKLISPTTSEALTEDEVRQAFKDLTIVRLEVGLRGAVCHFANADEASAAVGKRGRFNDRELLIEHRKYPSTPGPMNKMRGNYRGHAHRPDYNGNARYHHHHHGSAGDGPARPGSASGHPRPVRGAHRGGAMRGGMTGSRA